MSVEDVERLLQEAFDSLPAGSPCPLRELLLDGVRASLLELDALDRGHPVWAYLAVQTVNWTRLRNFLGWKVSRGLADERTWWALIDQDLGTGSCVSVEAWSQLETLSPAWRYEWAVLQGFFNFHLFSADRWMEELKGWLERRGLLEPALAYLRRPETVDDPCLRWLTPEATRQSLLAFAETIEVVRSV